MAGTAGPLARAGELWLACVQVRLRAEDYQSEDHLARRLEGWLGAIRRRTGETAPLLVAFPEDLGTFAVFFGHGDLLHRCASLKEAVVELIRRHRLATLARRLSCRASWGRALALVLSPQVEAAYRRLFSWAARRFRAFVVAGSAVLASRRSRCATHNVSYVFGPNGELLGWQPKTHLTPIEGPGQLDIAPAPLSELRVIPTAIGKLGVAICLDAFQEEVLRRLVEGGADLLVQPSANPAPWTPEQQADWKRSSWAAARRWPQLRYALNPMLVGELLGLGFEGQSSICTALPQLWTEGHYLDLPCDGGFLQVAATRDQEEILVARVPVEGLP